MSDEKRLRSTRLNLIAIATVALLPFVGSYLLYWFWQPAEHVNYGELISAPLPELQAAAPALSAKLPATGAVSDHIYLVDPLGNLVLRYPRDADPTRIKKDLSRLLRASRIG